MGKAIERIAIERGHEIVCKIDVDNQDDFDSKHSELRRLPLNSQLPPLLSPITNAHSPVAYPLYRAAQAGLQTCQKQKNV